MVIFILIIIIIFADGNTIPGDEEVHVDNDDDDHDDHDHNDQTDQVDNNLHHHHHRQWEHNT